MFIRVSFLEIEWCWILCISIPTRRIPSYNCCHFKQFRPEGQASALSGSQVDLEADSVSFQDRLDHATALRELRHVADGQNRSLVQASKILLSRPASAALRKRIWQLTDSCGIEIRLATKFLPPMVSPARVASSVAPKRILAENADGEVIVLRCGHFGWPFDESAEIVEIRSFHLIVTRLLLPEYARRGEEQPRNGYDRASQLKAVIAPQPAMLLGSSDVIRAFHGRWFVTSSTDSCVASNSSLQRTNSKLPGSCVIEPASPVPCNEPGESLLTSISTYSPGDLRVNAPLDDEDWHGAIIMGVVPLYPAPHLTVRDLQASLSFARCLVDKARRILSTKRPSSTSRSSSGLPMIWNQ
jgi:hypothetical protein